MAVQLEVSEQLQRIPMSREEFDALPEKPKAEYVGGIAIVSPAADRHHSYAKTSYARCSRPASQPRSSRPRREWSSPLRCGSPTSW